MWPKLSYEEFKETGYLLHMLVQAVGKLKLLTPFEPQWSNVGLSLTDRGLTSGLIPYKTEMFAVEIDLINHQVICSTASGRTSSFKIISQSVADLTKTLFDTLHSLQIDVTVNPKPQEIPNPIEFHRDTIVRIYQPELSHAWWQILLNAYHVMQKYHARFKGKTPPIALMWGTFDLRDVRFCGRDVTPTGINSGYLRRNAMDAEQIELGWWSGNELYPKPAFYSFTYPAPKGIENAKIQPAAAKWHPDMGEFILDYEDLRISKNPERDLLAFFNSTYEAGATLSGWDPELIGGDAPV